MKGTLKCISLTGIIILFTTTLSLYAQQTNRFDKKEYVSQDGDTLLYRLLSPDFNVMRKYPLVLFLHGSGERGNDNSAQLKWGVMQFATDQQMIAHPAFVVAPQCPADDAWASYKNDKNGNYYLTKTPTKPMKLVMELVKKLVKVLPVDTTRIYITGISMGGYGTYDAIERNPHFFAAAVPVCGRGDTTKAASIAHIPIWIFHGAEDPVVPVKSAYDMAHALINAGAHPALTLYPEVGHFSWLGAYSNSLMYEWLFKQHK